MSSGIFEIGYDFPNVPKVIAFDLNTLVFVQTISKGKWFHAISGSFVAHTSALEMTQLSNVLITNNLF